MNGSAGDKEGVYLAKVDSAMWDINLQRYDFCIFWKTLYLVCIFYQRGGKNGHLYTRCFGYKPDKDPNA